MSDEFRETHYVPDVVPDADLAYFEGSERRIGWGEQPAVLVLDMTEAFVEEAYPIGRADTGRPAAAATERLLDTAREAGLPVFYTTPLSSGVYPPDYPGVVISTVDSERSEAKQQQWDDANAIVDRLAPEPDDVVIQKPRASAFFDTHLANVLKHYGIDTLLVAGMKTSCCVRETVVDAHSNNFRVIVPPECVADASVISHEISLFDMDMKFADVDPLDEVLDRLDSRDWEPPQR